MYKHSLLMLSNLGWIFPAIVTYSYGHTLLAIPALGIMMFSSAFHATEHRVLEILDTAFAILYILVGPLLLYETNNTVSWGFAILGCIFAGSVWIQAKRQEKKKNARAYRIWHSAWHISSAGVTGLIYLFFVAAL